MSPDTQLELTLKSVIIGVFLALLLCGANMYLGLKIGTTVSASVPASIISLGILRLFKRYSILENNIAQTIASSGEAMASIVIFVFPAMLILGVWHVFHYWQIMFLSLCGSLIGISYSVLLRNVLLNDRALTFPEGRAIGQVLLSINKQVDKSGFKSILFGLSVAGIINFCQNGLEVLGSSYYKFLRINDYVIGFGTSFAPAVIGAGFLIGENTITGLVGAVIGWMILLPYFTKVHGVHNYKDLVSSAFWTWKTYVRPVGIGVFLFSGVATVVMMTKSIVSAIKEAFIALGDINHINHKDRDLNLKWLLALIILCIIPIAVFVYFMLLHCCVHLGNMLLFYTIAIVLISLIMGFVVAAVAGYLVGIVGASNSPLSGLLFIVVIILSMVFKYIFAEHINSVMALASSLVVMLVSFIGFSAVITNENIQDFKSGQMVGATPYKQQISLFIGVICTALVAPILINLIFNAYGIAGVVPHSGINPNNTLSAPQASAIAMITKNVLHSTQDWSLIYLGMLIGMIAFAIDRIGRHMKLFKSSPMMIGLGLYLPPDLMVGLFIGGFLNMLVKRNHVIRRKNRTMTKVESNNLLNKANVLVCGLIAGESIMGLVLAVPFVIAQSSDALSIVGPSFAGIAQLLSVIVTILLLIYVYRSGTKKVL